MLQSTCHLADLVSFVFKDFSRSPPLLFNAQDRLSKTDQRRDELVTEFGTLSYQNLATSANAPLPEVLAHNDHLDCDEENDDDFHSVRRGLRRAGQP
jgi:hypothetical protein